MKNYKKILPIALIGSMALSLGSCRDDWSKMNTDETQLTSPTPDALLATAEFTLYPNDYGTWFGCAPGYVSITQMAGFSSSMTEDRLLTTPGTNDGTLSLQKVYASMENAISQMSEEDQAKYAPYLEASRVLMIYNAILESDTGGDMPYTEGGRAFFGGPLLPKYDSVKDLYPLWNDELKNAVSVFKSSSTSGIAGQDIAYDFNWNKWAKLASSLRVKLATRMIHVDLATAKSIVSDAVADGVMTSADDDLYYFKSDSRANASVSGIDVGDLAFGSGNNTIDYYGMSAAEKVVDFMLENRDPRLRFQYEKNNWNSEILNYYLQHGYKNIVPPAVLERAEIEADGANFKFVKWKDEFGGDLWARYIGLPDAYNASNSNDPALAQFYKYNLKPEQGGHQITVKVGDNDAVFSYRPYSMMNEKLIRTNEDFTVPRIPGVNAARADYETDVPRHDLYMSSAEVNFYLAEFAIYGTPGLGSASEYFKKGVEQSVTAWDKLARDNHIPYYSDVYGVSKDDETLINLKDGEIAALLAKPAYQLTGNKADDLEKIFLNLEIHFMYMPADHYVTARRSGVPKFNSNLISRTDYTAIASIPANVIARRPNVSQPSVTDQMRDIILEVYQRNGWTINVQDHRTGLLNSERLWQDYGAPQWGAGPNVGI